jgi:hypothetical protein
VSDELSQAPGSEEFLPTRNSLLSRLRNWSDQDGWREFLTLTGSFLTALRSRVACQRRRGCSPGTVVSVAKALGEGRFKTAEGSSFKAWLQQIVRRRVMDHFVKSAYLSLSVPWLPHSANRNYLGTISQLMHPTRASQWTFSNQKALLMLGPSATE